MTALRTSFDKLVADLEGAQQKALSENQKRYDQMMAIYDEAIKRYQPGGLFEKRGRAKIERAVGGATQDLISSGLHSTTTAPATTSTIRMEGEAALEDIMMQRLTGLEFQKAGAIERVEDVGPDYGTVASLASQYGQGAGGMGATSARRGFDSEFQLPSGIRSAPKIPQATTDYARINAELAKRSKAAAEARAGLSQPSPMKSTMATPTLKPATDKQGPFDPWAFGNYESYAAAARGRGLNPGSKQEWQIAKKYRGAGQPGAYVPGSRKGKTMYQPFGG